MARKKTHQEFVEKVQKINSNIEILGEYTTSRNKIKCRCKIDMHEWELRASSLMNGTGCPVCGKKSSAEKNKKDYVKTLFDISEANKIKDARRNSKYSEKKTLEFVKKMKNVNPNIIVVGKYKRSDEKIECQCSVCGHKWSTVPIELMRGVGCPVCKKINRNIDKRKTHDQFVDEMLVKQPTISVIGKYTNAKTKVELKCDVCNCKWSAIPNSLLSMRNGCPQCEMSLGERLVKEYFISNDTRFEAQYILSGCKSKRPLRFDFAVFDGEQLKCLIEYQGKQHYEIIDYFGGEEGYNYRIKLDNIKRKYCAKKGIKLIEIPYWVKDIKTFLDENIKI